MNISYKELIGKFKGDILIWALVLLSAFLCWLFLQAAGKGTESEIIIFRDGTEIGRYNLSTNDTITVYGEDGSYNLIMVNNGSIKVTNADCPDQLCVRQRSICRNGESIICLPHRLVITIESPEESELDAVTN